MNRIVLALSLFLLLVKLDLRANYYELMKYQVLRYITSYSKLLLLLYFCGLFFVLLPQ